jgi:hypothetical protein
VLFANSVTVFSWEKEKQKSLGVGKLIVGQK